MINLSSFSINELLIIIMIIIITSFLLKELYLANHHGKLIMKVNQRKKLSIFWVVMLIISGLFMINDISIYIHYKELLYKDSILIYLFLIEFSILNIVEAIKYSEIRDKGIYLLSDFYKWSKIENYTWISPNIVQFKIATLFKIKLNIKLNIDKVEDKKKIEEILHRYITS